MKKVWCFFGLLCFVWNIVAQEQSINGTTSVYGIWNIPDTNNLANSSVENNQNSADLQFGILQDLSLRFTPSPLTHIFMNTLFTGSLMNRIDETLTQVAPIQMEIDELYLQVPFGDTLVMYAGKRKKEMGTARYFPLVNRINPRLFTNTSITSQGAGLVELNYFPLPWMNTAGLLFFKGMDYRTARWDELNLLGELDLHLSSLDVSWYNYLEHFENPYIGASAAWQIGFVTLYGESLLFHALSTGLYFSNETFTCGAEYSFHDLQHNAALYGAYNPTMFSHLTLSAEVIISFPSQFENVNHLWGYDAQFALSYQIDMALSLSMSYALSGGGPHTDYVLYKSDQGRCMLLLSIAY